MKFLLVFKHILPIEDFCRNTIIFSKTAAGGISGAIHPIYFASIYESYDERCRLLRSVYIIVNHGIAILNKRYHFDSDLPLFSSESLGLG
jgi:hypothetical protein